MKIKLSQEQIENILEDPVKAQEAGIKTKDPWWVTENHRLYHRAYPRRGCHDKLRITRFINYELLIMNYQR